MTSKALLSMLLLAFSSTFIDTSVNAQAFEGAPRQTQLVEHEILQKDKEFIGDIQTAIRTINTTQDVYINLNVVGFSLDLLAGPVEAENVALETSYYNPSWQKPTQFLEPSFVWWESGDNDSNYIVRIPGVVFDQYGSATLSVIYDQNGRKSQLRIKVSK
ncbi:MAG: hypothetical protein NT027_16730 [Proteobacteria bacterium]|nr:hypothetical protein [Pseudomonadota bacterium]